MSVITKRDLVLSVSKDTGLTQNDVLKVFQSSIDKIAEELSSGNDVALRNFGTFHVKKIKAKVGRNPNKPEHTVTIPPRTIVKFKTGKKLKESVGKLQK